MTQEQAEVLEQRIHANPEDFEARRQLVTYYRTSSKVAWDKKVPGLRRHALWLIEHHPEDDVQAPAVSPQFDPEGFAVAKKLWEAHLARPDVSPFLVFRAASFFAPHDKPYAEQLILRGMTMDPDSAALKARMPPDVGGYQWPVQLSSLYAAALRGSESAWGTYNDLRTHLDQVNSPYATQVRDKLAATTDANLLARVGEILVRPNGSIKDPALKQALDDIRALGVRYLERALELDPNLKVAKAILVRMKLPEQPTEADRLANRAHADYMRAEGTEYYKKDMAAGKQQRDEAKTHAEEALKMAAAHPQDAAYSAAIMTAHQVLATVALRDGERERALSHLRESVKVPTSEQIQYAPPFSWMRPVNRLLKEGERDAVVEFLETFAQLTIMERDRLLQDAKAIREGRMPSSYQHMVAREGQ
jgi:tetratricopeptide (TPR) repeat protein